MSTLLVLVVIVTHTYQLQIVLVFSNTLSYGPLTHSSRAYTHSLAPTICVTTKLFTAVCRILSKYEKICVLYVRKKFDQSDQCGNS